MSISNDVGAPSQNFSLNQFRKMKEYYLNSNTDICVDVKTVLHSSKTAKTGRDYQGVLTRDNDDHYTFIETIPPATGKRKKLLLDSKGQKWRTETV